MIHRPIFQRLQVVAGIVWQAIVDAVNAFVTWWQTNAQPIIDQGIQVLGAAFTWLWQNVIIPAWNGIVIAAQWAWANILQPIFNAIVDVIQNFLAPIFIWLWQTIITPVWNGIVAVIQWAWTTILQPLFQGIWAFITDILAPVFTWLWNEIIVPVVERHYVRSSGLPGTTLSSPSWTPLCGLAKYCWPYFYVAVE